VTPAIRVVDVTKRFRIPLDRSSTLKHRIVHLRSASRYHEFFALRDVNLEVQAGEFVGIIGPNGCGKSTLLKLLSRIYVPTSGTVEVHDRVSPFLELGVGFNPELSARENVFVNGALLGLSRAELHDRLDTIIDFAELRDFVDQKLKNFSSGMQVRLAFSVAIQANAPILLMDEVLAVGDARFQEKCFEVFWRYKRQGKTVVLVTHDLAAVEDYCDRAVLIDHGRVIADAGASEVTGVYRRMIDASFKQDAPATPVAAADESRVGTQEVSIEEVRLLDGDGHPTPSVHSGGALAVEVDFRATSDVGAIVCGIDLHRADGLHLGGSSTRAGGLTVSAPKPGDTARATFVVDHLPLRAGSYLVSASLADAHTQHVYDERRMAYRLRVTDEGVNTSGLIDLAGRWTLG
jgi:ABC-type polysaccharide/polyol phosphate transport system ATPase subunit